MKTLFLAVAILALTACRHTEARTPATYGEPPQSEITLENRSVKEDKNSSEQETKHEESPASEEEITESSDSNEEKEIAALPPKEKGTKNNISYPILSKSAPLPPKKDSANAAVEPKQPQDSQKPIAQAPPKADPINQVITVYVDELDSTYNSYNSTIKADYTIIHQDERYASILFTGQLDGAEYVQNFLSTLNIDLKTGGRTQLNQIVLIDGDFIDIVYDMVEEKIIGMGGDMNALFPHGIEDLINQADTSLTSDVHTYFTPTKITLIFKIPHELGDYVSVSVPNKMDAVFD